jgi:hypothetical protein
MPTLSRRGLGTKGIVHDPNDYDLDPQTFSAGANFLFDGNSATRAPIYRTVYSGAEIPFGLLSRRPASGFDLMFMVSQTGLIKSLVSDVVTDVTPAGFTPATGTDQWISTYLGDVTYINRATQAPYGFSSTSTQFATITGWDPTWRCASLRAYKDYLIALNVTKGATNYPQMVKTSDNTLAGQFPSSWDATDPTKNTTENILADMTSPIVDGAVLGDIFVIYSKDQVWSMQAISSSDVFRYRRLYTEGGIIAPNCVIERQGQHYVFGQNDIYTHNGSQMPESLVELKNRNFIFRTLDTRNSKRCFTVYHPRLKCVFFCYPTLDSSAPFLATNGCNRAFVYHVPTGASSFIDLPDAISATVGNINSVFTWTTLPSSWQALGGAWSDLVSPYDSHLIFSTITGVQTTNKLVGYDYTNGGALPRPFDSAYNSHAYLERTGIDLDNDGAPLTAYKIFTRILPQFDTLAVSPIPVFIQTGTQIVPLGPVTWGAPVPFIPGTDYKVDFRQGGRYMALRLSTDLAGPTASSPVTASQVMDLAFNGYDVEVASGGNR